MTAKSRLIMLAFCFLVFLVATPYLIMYSLGYRVNFATWEVMATGGIFVQANPQDAAVFIDNIQQGNNGFFPTTFSSKTCCLVPM